MAVNGSQMLPADDTFDYPSAHYGTNLCLYLGCQVSNTGSPHVFQIGRMHNGYQVIDGSGVIESPCAVTNDVSETTTEAEPRGFMWRDQPQEDQIVSARIRARSLAGSINYSHLSARGVMARVQAGTLLGDATSEVRYRNVTCYMATVYLSGTSLLFSLDRVNAGTVTNLQVTTVPLASAILLDVNEPVTVTLDVRTSGGDPVLVATFAGFSAQNDIVLNHTDSSASKIVGAGRAGFHMGRDRTYSSGAIQVVDLCEVFTIEEVGVGKLVVDAFVRYQPSAALAIPDDQFGNTGESLQMAFTWDQFTHANGAPRILRDTGSQRVQFDYLGSDSADARAFISARPATSSFSQHRRVVTQLSAQPGTNIVWVGLCLRASQPIPEDQTAFVFPGFNGYVAVCVGRSSAATVFWEIHRIVAGIPLLLAEFDDTLGTYFPGYGTTFQMEFECYPQTLASINAPAVLKLTVDGVQVALVKDAAAPAGVQVDANGTVVDGTANRIPPTFGEGMVTFNGINSVLSATFDDWVELALTNSVLPDRDQASVAVGNEGTASATFTVLDAGDPMDLTIEHYSIITDPYDSGHRRAIPRFTDSEDKAIGRRTYRFARSGVSKAELDSLVSFFDAREGAEEVFNWTPPREAAARKVHLVDGAFRHAKDDFGTYSVVFTLQTNV